MNLTKYQKKTLDIYHKDGHEKAWHYWKLTGHNYGIFLGEISSNEFISGDDLINHIGLTKGVSQHSDTSWLKFILDGEIIIIPMKPIMHSVSWRHIYQAGAVYGTDDYGSNSSGGNQLQNVCVTIDSNTYKVTILKGANSYPILDNMGYDIPLTHNSEWNRLMYPIHHGVHTNMRNPISPSTPFDRWASYSDRDLLVHHDYGNGSRSWTQETHGLDDNYHLQRGYGGLTFAYGRISTNAYSSFGYRPALRMIQK